MTTLVLTSAAGAPGVTTTALGLALTWPAEVTLVDADRDASHAILAGYLAGQSPHGLGIQGLLHAHRERRDLERALTENRIALPPRPADARHPSEDPPRWFVPGFTHLGSVDHVSGVWGSLLEAQRSISGDVIVDAGRTSHDGLPESLLAMADRVGLVCRTSLVGLAALRLHLPGLLDKAAPGSVGLVLVGPGRPYASREVADQFGVPVLAEIGWAPREADDLHHGVPLTHTWRRTSLARGYQRAGTALRQQMTAGLAESGATNPDAPTQAESLHR